MNILTNLKNRLQPGKTATSSFHTSRKSRRAGPSISSSPVSSTCWSTTRAPSGDLNTGLTIPNHGARRSSTIPRTASIAVSTRSCILRTASRWSASRHPAATSSSECSHTSSTTTCSVTCAWCRRRMRGSTRGHVRRPTCHVLGSRHPCAPHVARSTSHVTSQHVARGTSARSTVSSSRLRPRLPLATSEGSVIGD